MSRFSSARPARLLSVLVVAVVIGAILILRAPRQGGSAPAHPSWRELRLRPNDRVLILAPHPDDETLACAGIAQEARARDLPVRIVFLTYGDANELAFMVTEKHPVIDPGAVLAMGRRRRLEALAAARVLGVETNELFFLGYPDDGTLAVWRDHWNSQKPHRGILTHVDAVPYPSAFRPGAPYRGDDILRDLTTLIREFHPTKVFLSHPEDQNRDHRALYLFAQVALWNLEEELRPETYPYLVHFRHWPQPRGYHPEQPLVPPAAVTDDQVWWRYALSAEQAARKEEALRAHRSQMNYGARLLQSFVRTDEIFGGYAALRLRPGASNAPIAPDRRREDSDATDEERARWLGIEQRHLSRVGDDLLFSLTLSRPLAKTAALSLDVFGYRSDRPFARMPKLHIRIGVTGHQVHDNGRRLDKNVVSIKKTARRIEVRLPLARLDHPDRILTSARTYAGAAPLDRASWRAVDLRGEARDE